MFTANSSAIAARRLKKGKSPNCPPVHEITAVAAAARTVALKQAFLNGNASVLLRLFSFFSLAAVDSRLAPATRAIIWSGSCLHKYRPRPVRLPTTTPTLSSRCLLLPPVSRDVLRDGRLRNACAAHGGGRSGGGGAVAGLPRRRPHTGRVRRRRLAERPCHLLRRQRCLRHHGRGVWVREPVQPGVRGEQRGAEHGAVQRGAELRRLLRDQVREPAGVEVVPPGEPLHPHHRHQLLPAQLRPPLRQRRLVQSSSPPLRPRHAHVPPHRRVPRRHRPRLLPPGAVQEEGRGEVYDKRVQVLQPGAHHQRGRSRRHREGEREGVGHGVDAHVAELGPELAVQLGARRRRALLPRHRQRPPHLHLLERRPSRLAVRPDLRGQELPSLRPPPTVASTMPSYTSCFSF